MVEFSGQQAVNEFKVFKMPFIHLHEKEGTPMPLVTVIEIFGVNPPMHSQSVLNPSGA